MCRRCFKSSFVPNASAFSSYLWASSICRPSTSSKLNSKTRSPRIGERSFSTCGGSRSSTPPALICVFEVTSDSKSRASISRSSRIQVRYGGCSGSVAYPTSSSAPRRATLRRLRQRSIRENYEQSGGLIRPARRSGCRYVEASVARLINALTRQRRNRASRFDLVPEPPPRTRRDIARFCDRVTSGASMPWRDEDRTSPRACGKGRAVGDFDSREPAMHDVGGPKECPCGRGRGRRRTSRRSRSLNSRVVRRLIHRDPVRRLVFGIRKALASAHVEDFSQPIGAVSGRPGGLTAATGRAGSRFQRKGSRLKWRAGDRHPPRGRA